ncbi:MAG: hypothetical protein O7A63_03395 [Acidobacteria bacterium]|nr:hypothetical protein [Acidobacteriota bacterium]
MHNSFVAAAPFMSSELADRLMAPILWVLEAQRQLLGFFLYSPDGWVAAGKAVFLLFPAVVILAGLWCTQLSLYTIPFRSGRIRFAQMMLLGWWDAARAIWHYWVGLFRFALVATGWVLTLARLAVRFLMESIRQIVIAPFSMTGRLSRSYFQPGVPWIAFIMLLFWCVIEATIFTYTLYPTVSEVLADLVGMDAPRFTGPVLYMFLLMLILGSFACLQAFLDTVKRGEYRFVIQMLLVELFVMLFEVMFLYRELVDAITPWIAQQTSEEFRLGIVFTLSLAAFGWIGIRGMTWFLFGQFGTPPLLAFISRRPLAQYDEPAPGTPVPVETGWWRDPINDFKMEIEWLHIKGAEVIEYLTLPVLQVLAASLNFALILLTSNPAMSLPFKSLKDVMETRDIASFLKVRPRKAETPS